MQKTIVVGGQYGDEGKGKIVDALIRQPGVRACFRYNGGANAGHTVYCPEGSFATHQIPSGVAYPDVINVIGPGCLIDPHKLKAEYDDLCAALNREWLNVRVAATTHVITNAHISQDIASESAREHPLGTCKTGNGPAYAAKALRTGKTARQWVTENYPHPTAVWLDGLLTTYCQKLWDLERGIDRAVWEGAHGAMLDIDHGHYPYVTSSTCTTGGVYAAGGCPPQCDDVRVMVVKLHTTRVGAGPMPELYFEDEQEIIRDAAHEFGTTTGRPRKIGALDLNEIAYACRLNSPTYLALTMADVWESMPFCWRYMRAGELHSMAWDLDKAIGLIEGFTGVPVGLVSVGRQRDALLDRKGVLLGA